MRSAKLGPFTLTPIETGTFKLDGGAMFGVVPKTLWSKSIPADVNNRIFMGMRCLLVKSEATGRVYLIDCGLGTKFDEKQRAIYEVDNSSSDLISSLAKAGVKPDDITDLVLTHLHFDHVGGATKWENGEAVTVFKKATFHVTKAHWQTAIQPNQREKASFFKENIVPLEESGRLNIWPSTPIYEKGFDAIIMNGHTLGQQLPRFQWDHKTLVYAGDLLPTKAHVPLPWIMGYDMQPLVTLSEKETFLKSYSNTNSWIFLEHDAENEVIQIEETNGKYAASASRRLSDIFPTA